jgi:hypothetical protein
VEFSGAALFIWLPDNDLPFTGGKSDRLLNPDIRQVHYLASLFNFNLYLGWRKSFRFAGRTGIIIRRVAAAGETGFAAFFMLNPCQLLARTCQISASRSAAVGVIRDCPFNRQI